MQATFSREDDDYVEFNITDNYGVGHTITFEKETGEIAYHGQEGYPDDASKRTSAGNEHVNQARRFAKFYVYRKRGYDTVDPCRNPDRIAAVTLALGSLSPDTLLEYLGDYYQQLRHYQGKAKPIVETPERSEVDIIWLEQDVYLALDDEAAMEALTEQVINRNLLAALEEATSQGTAGKEFQAKLEAALSSQGIDVDEQADSIAETLLAGVGPLEVCWKQGQQKQRRTAPGTGTEYDRDPDARLQLFANLYEFEDPAGFQRALIHHLRCQIRDCYIGMGIAPPEDARVQGPGIYEYVGNYEKDDFYPSYNDTRTEITDWQEDHTPDDLFV